MTILYIHIFYMPHISAALSYFPGHRVRGPGYFQQVFARDSIYERAVTYTGFFLGPGQTVLGLCEYIVYVEENRLRQEDDDTHRTLDTR